MAALHQNQVVHWPLHHARPIFALKASAGLQFAEMNAAALSGGLGVLLVVCRGTALSDASNHMQHQAHGSTQSSASIYAGNTTKSDRMGSARTTDAAGIEAMYTPLQAVAGEQGHVQHP